MAHPTQKLIYTFSAKPQQSTQIKVKIGDHSSLHILRMCHLPCPRGLQLQPSSWPHSVWWLHHTPASRNTTSIIPANLFPLCNPTVEVSSVEPDGWANTREVISATVWAESSWLSLCPLTALLYRVRSVFCQAISGGEKKNKKKTQEISKQHALLVHVPRCQAKKSLFSSLCWKQSWN